MLAIGDVLTREDGRKFRLCGVQRTTGEWIAEPLDSFGPVITLTAGELAHAFGIGSSEAAAPDEHTQQNGWYALAAADRAARTAAPEPLPTPEEVFAAVAAPAPKSKRKR